MTQTFGQNWQDVNEAALKSLGKAARSSDESIMGGIATEFDSPLRPHATFPTPDGKINFTLSPAPSSDGASRSIPAMKTIVNSVAQSTLDFQSNSHATTGATFVMTWPTSNTLNYYRRVGFTLDFSGQINVLFSPEVASLGSLANPGTVLNKKFLAIGWVDVQCTDITNNLFKSANAGTAVITNSTISRFGAGGGAGGGGGLDVYATVAAAKAEVNGADDDMAEVVETETIYRYEATSYSGVTADDKFLISVTSDANARWVAVAGRYRYQPNGDIYALVADMKAVTTGMADRMAYCKATSTWYIYATSSIVADDTSVISITSDASSRWIGIAGKYSYVLPGNTYSAIADLKAIANGQDTQLVYCVATDSYYRYSATGHSSVTANDTTIVSVTSDANARWVAVAGKYIYTTLGSTYATVASLKAEVAGVDTQLVYCVETETYYRYSGSAFSGVTGDDKEIITVTSAASARWVAVAGKYIYNLPGSTYALVADLQAEVAGLEGDIAYCLATDTWYRYYATAYSSVTADSTNVVAVTTPSTARWMAVGGKYNYNVLGSTYLLVADMKAVVTGQDNILAYCVANETYYRYEATAYAAVPGDDQTVITVTSDASARWVAVAGKYNLNALNTSDSSWEDMKAALDQLPYEYLEGAVFALDLETKTDVSTTATWNLSNFAYKFLSVGNFFLSKNMHGAEFLADPSEITEVYARICYDTNFIDATPTVQVSRAGASNLQTMTVERIGTTNTFLGKLVFAAGSDVTIESYATGSDTTKALTNTGSNQKFSQPFTATETEKVNTITVYLNKTGSPSGALFVSIYSNSGSDPSAKLLATLPVSIAGLSSGANTLALATGGVLTDAVSYHIVFETDDSYKSTYVASTHQISLTTDSAGDGTLRQYNGTSWAAVASFKAKYLLSGYVSDLRIKVTAVNANTQLKGIGLYYGLEPQGSSNYKKIQVFSVNSQDNTTTFLINKWIPDADLLKVYCVETGQVFKFPAFTLTGTVSGVNVVFPDKTFYTLPNTTYTIIIDQNEGDSFDNSDSNAFTLVDNHLGSSNSNLDKSIAGRGIYLRNAAGVLRELALDASDNIIIKSVP